MLHINIVCIGKIKETYLKDAIIEYSKRLSKYCMLSIIELNDEPIPNNASMADEEKIIEVDLDNCEIKVEKDKDNQIIDFKKEKCKDHPNKYIEYICFNCNEYLCSESLLIFNKESVNKHNNHIIISLEDVNKFKLYNIIKEYQSLREKKNKLDIKIKE